MAQMGNYCKAYPIQRFRQYPQWHEETANLRKERKTVDGREVEVTRELDDESFFYLQENFVVTDGIFIDENIVFGAVTPEWMEFCKNQLEFAVPDYARPEEPAA